MFMPAGRKRNHDGSDVPPTKVPRIEGKYLYKYLRFMGEIYVRNLPLKYGNSFVVRKHSSYKLIVAY